ncbi:MAG: hypothetical protein ACJ77K_14700 [Bacteroidia bacterium]
MKKRTYLRQSKILVVLICTLISFSSSAQSPLLTFDNSVNNI